MQRSDTWKEPNYLIIANHQTDLFEIIEINIWKLYVLIQNIQLFVPIANSYVFS